MKVDAAIVGGGTAGCATALALARRGRSVLVLERTAGDVLRVGEHLSPEALPVLARLGLAGDLMADGHLPSLAVRAVWGGVDPYEQDYLFNPHGHGWNIDRSRFDRMLTRAVESAGVRIWRSARIGGLRRDADGWRLQIDRGGQLSRLSASILVDASGRAAALARRLGSRRVLDDRLIALVRWYHGAAGSAPADSSLLVEAIETGWWYAAPLPDDRMVAVFLTDRDLIAGGSGKVWRGALEAALHTRRRLAPIGARQTAIAIRAAHSARVEPVAGRDWLAVGEAATAFDPLAARGIAHALDSGLRAGDVVDRTLAGDPEAVNEYAADVQREWQAYLDERAAIYGREERWRDACFWHRRASRVGGQRSGRNAIREGAKTESAASS
jgi:flavin-dependent dehydrogenase